VQRFDFETDIDAPWIVVKTRQQANSLHGQSRDRVLSSDRSFCSIVRIVYIIRRIHPKAIQDLHSTWNIIKKKFNLN